GAVGGVRDIKNVSFLARAVMEHSGHVMLVGEGAERFAIAQGFPKENLLTERSRKIWMLWKETHSNQDWWGPGVADPNWKPPQSRLAAGRKTSRSPARIPSWKTCARVCRRRKLAWIV